jgi:hypothetical protein
MTQRLWKQLVPVAVLVGLLLSGCSCGGSSEGGPESERVSRIDIAEKNADDVREAQSFRFSDDEGSGDASSSEESDDEEKEDPEKLFIIERSKNANIVRYDAQLTDEGELDSDKPVVAYWILHADNGQREDLSWMQRKMAYGFKTKPAPDGEGYIMEMKPLPKRELRIKVVDGDAQAHLKIDGKPAVLKKIYVDSDQGWTGPDVNYVKLFGKDLETGEERTEKIVPE